MQIGIFEYESQQNGQLFLLYDFFEINFLA